MPSLNKVFLIGHLGQDPEVRHTGNGTAVANLSMATTARWKDPESQERRERTEWHRVVVWGRQAEVAEGYLKKGSPVHVEGELRTRSWMDKDGNKRYTTEVVARRIQLVGKAEKPAGEPPASENPEALDHELPEDHIQF